VAEGVRESGEGQMRGGEASRDSVPAYNWRGCSRSTVHLVGDDWPAQAAVRGGVVR
jgi:hypothetical protein